MKGNKLFLFAGVGLALVAVLLGITMTGGGGDNDKRTDAAQQEAADPESVTVVRLLQDIEAHTVIRPEMVERVEVDAATAPSDPVTAVGDVVGQSYTIKATATDILRVAFVAPPGITASIEPGFRAVSLAVDAQGSMSGLVVAGDYVDVVFEARVNLVRVLDIGGLEIVEDGTYTLEDDTESEGGSSSSGGDSSSDEESDEGSGDEDSANSAFQTGSIQAPYQGKDGSEFVVLDGGDMLEPVAKMLVQDVKVIRVIAPGERYDAQGQPVPAPEEGGPTEDEVGQLIVQVTPQQAEAIAFMQSDLHTYSVAVRGKDDHAVVATTGITFEILMTEGTWSLPWPEPIVAEDAREAQSVAAGTPVASEGGEPDEDS